MDGFPTGVPLSAPWRGHLVRGDGGGGGSGDEGEASVRDSQGGEMCVAVSTKLSHPNCGRV